MLIKLTNKIEKSVSVKRYADIFIIYMESSIKSVHVIPPHNLVKVKICFWLMLKILKRTYKYSVL